MNWKCLWNSQKYWSTIATVPPNLQIHKQIPQQDVDEGEPDYDNDQYNYEVSYCDSQEEINKILPLYLNLNLNSIVNFPKLLFFLCLNIRWRF